MRDRRGHKRYGYFALAAFCVLAFSIGEFLLFREQVSLRSSIVTLIVGLAATWVTKEVGLSDTDTFEALALLIVFIGIAVVTQGALIFFGV